MHRVWHTDTAIPKCQGPLEIFINAANKKGGEHSLLDYARALLNLSARTVVVIIIIIKKKMTTTKETRLQKENGRRTVLHRHFCWIMDGREWRQRRRSPVENKLNTLALLYLLHFARCIGWTIFWSRRDWQHRPFTTGEWRVLFRYQSEWSCSIFAQEWRKIRKIFTLFLSVFNIL